MAEQGEAGLDFRWGLDRVSQWLLLVLLTLGVALSALIPPFQSPDEFDHVKRAYLLLEGQMLLATPPGQASGGPVDSGLLSYISGFRALPFHTEKKMTREEENRLAPIQWSGTESFSTSPGTGYYLPLAYVPQAIGLGLGRALSLSIEQSYRLARFFVLAFSLLALTVAFRLFPANALLVGLLILPMSVYQLCSASLDGFTTALTVLFLSLFMRTAVGNLRLARWMLVLMSGCLLILATTRMHLLPLLLLPAWLWWARRERVFLWQFLIVSTASLAWLVLAIKHTHLGLASKLGTGETMAFYAGHPGSLLHALAGTLLDPVHLGFYRDSFIGILGWLDARFAGSFYPAASLCLLLLAALSVSLADLRSNWRPRLLLLVLSAVMTLLVFVALLISWNPVPAQTIEGVQGRYFIGPAIVLAYALAGAGGFGHGWMRALRVATTASLALLGAFHLPALLVERYYTAPYAGPQQLISYAIPPNLAASGHCSLDDINGVAVAGQVLPQGSEAVLRGWMADARNQVPADAMLVLRGVGKSYALPLVAGEYRPDVAAALGSEALNSAGYSVPAQLDGVAPGAYAIMLVYGPPGQQTTCPLNATITIGP